MKQPDDDRIVMIGASFEEIAAEAAIAVKLEMDKQIREITPVMTNALKEGTAALNEAIAAVRRYRIAMFALTFLCSVKPFVSQCVGSTTRS